MRSTLCLLTVQGGIPNPPLINHRTHLCFRSLGSAALAPAGAIPAGSAASDQGLDSSQPHPLSLGCCGSQGHKIRAVFTAFDIPTCPPLSRSWQKKPAWNSEICCHPLLNFVSSPLTKILSSLGSVSKSLDVKCTIVASQGSFDFERNQNYPEVQGCHQELISKHLAGEFL